MPNVFVLTYSMEGCDHLLRIFDHPEKAEEYLRDQNPDVDFQSQRTVGLGRWTWNQYTITELSVR